MTEAPLTGPYRKDAADEDFVQRLNDVLAPHEEDAYRPVADAPPTVHIVGVPRSGTTLLGQLVACHLDVGYVNNLVAAFWKAPVHGIRLSQKILGDARPASLESDFGRTTNVHDPHEFGYFWKRWLRSDALRFREAPADEIDWDGLARSLGNMATAFEKPVVFKSFLLGAYVAEIRAVLPRTRFLRIRRDLAESARSLLKMRRAVRGDDRAWVSIAPPDLEDLFDRSPWEQVAAQVFFLDRALSGEIRRAGAGAVLEIDYRALCTDPRIVLSEVRSFLTEAGVEPAWTDVPVPTLRCRRPAPEDDDMRRIRAALGCLRAEHGAPAAD